MLCGLSQLIDKCAVLCEDKTSYLFAGKCEKIRLPDGYIIIVMVLYIMKCEGVLL